MGDLVDALHGADGVVQLLLLLQLDTGPMGAQYQQEESEINKTETLYKEMTCIFIWNTLLIKKNSTLKTVLYTSLLFSQFPFLIYQISNVKYF